MKKFLFVLSLTCISSSSFGQRYMGIATGNWGGMSSLYLNPANIADNRDRLVIDLVNINAGVDNSLGKLNTVSGLNKFINGNSTNINDVFTYSNKQNFSLVAPYAELRGPGFMLAINHKHSVGFSTRVRGMNQFNNFNQSVYRTIADSTYTANGVTLNSQNFNWTGHVWAEAAVTYGVVLLEKGKHELKAGVTLRYLSGIGYLGLKGNNLNLRYSGDTITATNTDIQYSSSLASSNSTLSTGIGSNSIFDNLVNSKTGNGVGGDIGIVYDYIENPEATSFEMDGKKNVGDQTINRYKLRVSASVTDLGSIFYNSNGNFSVNVRGNGTLTGQGLIENVKNYDDFRAYAKKQGFNVDTGKASNRLYMPTTIVLSADYHAWKNIYVNATYFNNVVNRQNYGNSYYNQIIITPRYDTRRYSIAVPITYSALSESMKMGIGIRAYGFFVGSDDMLALVSHQYGMNFYVGGFVPFHKKHIKDRDGDHVSDKKDKCPEDMGTWKSRGCPDKDEDTKKEDPSEREN
ncbi:DUF5723 family protein [Flavipsychrobacter stenotrophus]|nr:DUF5723 family protein [Flavipsychrobacter stenotrophus]